MVELIRIPILLLSLECGSAHNIHTDAIRESLIPQKVTRQQANMERRQFPQGREYTRLCHIGTISCFEQYGKYQCPAYPARTSAEPATYPSEQNSNHANEIDDEKQNCKATKVS